MSVEAMIDALIGREGGYVNNPDDTGGATRWGVTETVARAYGYKGDMKALPRESAVAIYRQKYWIKPGYAKVAQLSQVIAEELFDTGVNMGASVGSEWLQRCLNVFNVKGTLYADIAVDGSIGPASITALKAFLAKRGKEGEVVMLKALNCLQGARYIDLSERRMANETFVYGWLRTRVG